MDTLSNEYNPLEEIRPLMKKYGVRCTPQQFYDAVNRHFHAAESVVYDEIHREMWQTLPCQFALLTADCLPVPQKALRVLDIGSGTGLSAELFLQTTLGSRTTDLHLLDTSPQMLSVANDRAVSWSTTVQTHCCLISDLPAAEKFDVIIACSVLHHIADLVTFLRHVSDNQVTDGLFLHLQDQNADYANDPRYLCRLRECREVQARQTQRPFLRKLTPARVYRRIAWELNKRKDYIARTSQSLIDAGVIRKRMEAADIWRITDIRLSPTVNGVSFFGLRSLLPDYDPVSQRSYAFYGQGGDGLPIQFKQQEKQLVEQGELNGHFVAGAWRKRSVNLPSGY